MAESHDRDPKREQDGESATLQNPQQMAAEMANAFQELARGERTASALERQLDGIESRIDELLAAAEAGADPTEDSLEGTEDPNGRLGDSMSNNHRKGQ